MPHEITINTAHDLVVDFISKYSGRTSFPCIVQVWDYHDFEDIENSFHLTDFSVRELGFIGSKYYGLAYTSSTWNEDLEAEIKWVQDLFKRLDEDG